MPTPAVPGRTAARLLAGALAVGWLALTPAPAPAAITLSGTSTATTETSSITIARPAGTLSGDLMVMTVVATGTGTFTLPSGWTSIRSTSNGSSLRMQTFRRFAAAGDPATFTVALGSARSASGAIASYADVEAAAPIDASAAASGASGTATATTITTGELSARLVVPVGFAVSGGSGGTPTSTTQRWATASAGSALVMGDEVRPAVGATGARTATSTPANSGWAAHAIALQESPSLTVDFSAAGALAWGAWSIGSNVSPEQTFAVTSNRSWGVKLSTDGADGRMTEWNGSLYLSRKLAAALEWRLSSLGGSAQATSFAAASPTQALVTTARPASLGPVAVGVSYRQSVSYADDAQLGANAYRKVITYVAQQGF